MNAKLTQREIEVIDAVANGARAENGDELNIDENDEGNMLFNHREEFIAWMIYAGWDTYEQWMRDVGVTWDELRGKRWSTQHNRVYMEE